jgi:hypothetical protein
VAFFFATSDDLLPVLLGVEARLKVQYTRMGHAASPAILSSFRTARDLPTLFTPAQHESSVAGPMYLITMADAGVSPRQITPNHSQTQWAIDQLNNPDSTVLRHGGLYAERILLRGEIRTTSTSAIASKLQRAFDAAIRRTFVKIKACYVGERAEKLLDSGYRLTVAAQSPIEIDLRRD